MALHQANVESADRPDGGRAEVVEVAGGSMIDFCALGGPLGTLGVLGDASRVVNRWLILVNIFCQQLRDLAIWVLS